MKFTTQTRLFSRVFKILFEDASPGEAEDISIVLSSCYDQLWVIKNGKAAQIEAEVWEEGQCSIRANNLFRLIAFYADNPELTIAVDSGGLRIRDAVAPVSSYSRLPIISSQCQFHLATDLGMIPTISTQERHQEFEPAY